MSLYGVDAALVLCLICQISAQEEVADGGNVLMDCKEHVDDGSINWYAIIPGGGSSHLMMSQNKRGSFMEIYEGPYKDRLSRPEWGVCQLSNITTTDARNYSCDQTYPEETREKAFSYKIIVKPSNAPALRVSSGQVTQGQQAVFTCTAHLSTQGTSRQYQWKRSDGGTVSGTTDGNTRRINSTVPGDQASYSCLVKNIAGESPWSAWKKLDVDVPPDRTEITGYRSGQILYSGENVTLTCTTHGGRPDASLTWNCLGNTGTTVSGEDRVTNSFTTEVQKGWNERKCSCRADQRALSTPQTAEVEFTAYSPPEGPFISAKLVWLENNTYTPTCGLTYQGVPSPNYVWCKNNVPLGPASALASINLTVTKEDNNKVLKCQVRNSHTQHTGNHVEVEKTLDVQYSPRVSLSPTEVTVTLKENETLALKCSANSNPEAMNNDFLWTRNGEEYGTGKQMGIQWIKNTDAGMYRCTVTVRGASGHGTLSGHAEKNVVVQYLHLTTSGIKEVTEYDPFSLNCSAEGVPSSIIFKNWVHIRNDQPVEVNISRTDGNIVYLESQSVEYTDTGQYVCQAGNTAFPSVSAKQTLQVLYTAKQPQHPSAGKRVFTALGQDVSLSISVQAYPESVTFTWNHTDREHQIIVMNDTRTTITSHHLLSTLNITNVTMTDLGNYTVHAANGVRQGSNFKFLLQSQDGPGTPHIDPSRSFPTAVSVEICWWSSFDGGYTQNFSVHYKEPGKEYMVFQSGIKDQGFNILHSCRVTPLMSQTSYTFQVVAHNKHNGGSKAASNEVTIMTLDRPVMENSTTVVQLHGSYAYLKWQKATGRFDTQRVEQFDTTDQRQKRRSTGCEAPLCVVHENLTAEATSYNISGLAEGRTYQFDLVLFYKGDVVQRQAFHKEVETGPVAPNQERNAALVAGSVLGVLAVIAVAVMIVFILLRRRKIPKDSEHNGVRKLLPGRKKQSDTVGGVINEGHHTDAHGINENSEMTYAVVQKKKAKGKAISESAEVDQPSTLYAEPDISHKKKKKTSEKNGRKQQNKQDTQHPKPNTNGEESVAGTGTDYSEVVKGSKAKKKETAAEDAAGGREMTDVYTEVVKDGKKKEQKKLGKKQKQKEENKANVAVYADVQKNDKIPKGKNKNKGKANAAEVYENMNVVYQNTGDGAVASGGDDLYSEVQSGKTFSNPPPGSDGLQYAAVEFVKPKKSQKKEAAPVYEASEYAAIDYTKKGPQAP